MLTLQFRLALLFLLFTLANYQANGQKLVSGYIVTVAGDSILGAIRPNSSSSMTANGVARQLHVNFTPMGGHTENISLTAAQVSAYGYINKQDTVRYVSISLPYGSKNQPLRFFLRQLIGGTAQLYDLFGYTSLANIPIPGLPHENTSLAYQTPFFSILSPPSNSTQDHILVVYRAGEAKLQNIIWWKFNKDAAAYFADYPKLADAIQAGKYKSRDIREVIRLYNAWHREQPMQP